MTPADRPAALTILLLTTGFILLSCYLAYAIAGIIRDRPVVLKDRWTGKLTIVRSPNPKRRPRRHHRL